MRYLRRDDIGDGRSIAWYIQITQFFIQLYNECIAQSIFNIDDWWRNHFDWELEFELISSKKQNRIKILFDYRHAHNEGQNTCSNPFDEARRTINYYYYYLSLVNLNPVIDRSTWRYSHDKYRNWWFSSIDGFDWPTLKFGVFVCITFETGPIKKKKQLKLLFDIGYRKLIVFMLLR